MQIAILEIEQQDMSCRPDKSRNTKNGAFNLTNAARLVSALSPSSSRTETTSAVGMAAAAATAETRSSNTTKPTATTHLLLEALILRRSHQPSAEAAIATTPATTLGRPPSFGYVVTNSNNNNSKNSKNMTHERSLSALIQQALDLVEKVEIDSVMQDGEPGETLFLPPPPPQYNKNK
jgi:hypothetical protein